MESLREFRNSDGLTPAECWRKEAQRLDQEARVLKRQSDEAAKIAATYRQIAKDWEDEHGEENDLGWDVPFGAHGCLCGEYIVSGCPHHGSLRELGRSIVGNSIDPGDGEE